MFDDHIYKISVKYIKFANMKQYDITEELNHTKFEHFPFNLDFI